MKQKIYDTENLTCPECGGPMHYEDYGREAFCICDSCSWMLESSLYVKIINGVIKYKPGDRFK